MKNNNNNYALEPTQFFLPSEKLVPINDLTDVNESQRFVQIGDGNLLYIKKISPLMTGAIQAFAGLSAPEEWLLCDGAEQLIADYPDLAEYLGDIYGNPSDDLHFILPNLEGRFLRGATDTVAVGTKQEDGIQNITGSLSTYEGVFTKASGVFATSGSTGTPQRPSSKYGDHADFDASRVVRTNPEDETRPVNVSILWFIHI